MRLQDSIVPHYMNHRKPRIAIARDTFEHESVGARTRNFAASNLGPVQQRNRAPVVYRPRDGQGASEKRLPEADRAHAPKPPIGRSRCTSFDCAPPVGSAVPQKRHPLSPVRWIKKFRTGGHNRPETLMVQANRITRFGADIDLVSRRLQQFLALTKPRVVSLIVFTAVLYTPVKPLTMWLMLATFVGGVP